MNMMKNRLVFLLIVCLMMCIAAPAAMADTTEQGIVYDIVNGNAVRITGYTGTAPTVVIPSAIDGKPVTTIGNSAFDECATLEVVEIPTSVTVIGNYAFYDCSCLTEVIFRCGLPSFGANPFSGSTAPTAIHVPHDEVESYKAKALSLFGSAPIYCNEHGSSCQVVITVAASPSAGGIVEGGGTYDKGQTVTLTATPDTGYTFAGWQINGQIVNTNTAYSFIATENLTVTALFTLNDYVVTVTTSKGGKVPGGGAYIHGDTVALTAVPDDGYSFAGWYINDQLVDMDTAYSFTATENVTLNAMFEKIPVPVPPDVNDLPKTGDDSNVILWSALACISVIGMMTLVRKRKEA